MALIGYLAVDEGDLVSVYLRTAEPGELGSQSGIYVFGSRLSPGHGEDTWERGEQAIRVLG